MTTQTTWNQLEQQLNPVLIESVKSKLGFQFMMPVQKEVIPLFINNKDVVVEAQTGSGKTLAFLLPILNFLMKQKYNQLDIISIILSPTHELAQQTYEILLKLISGLDKPISTQLVIGGYPISKDIENYKTTPKKLSIMLDIIKSNIKFPVEYLVLDEADKLIEQQFYQDIAQILNMINKQRRTGLFSATLSQAKVQELIKLGLRNPVKIQFQIAQNDTDNNNYDVPQQLANYYLILANRVDKIVWTINYLKTNPNQKLLLFVNTCASVQFYFKLFSVLSIFEAQELFQMHGLLKQKKRNKVYDEFKSKSKAILITTDVMARGIDFEGIQTIIQLDPPQDPSNFVHRIGRTARCGQHGQAIVLIEESESTFINYLKQKSIKIRDYQINVQNHFNQYSLISCAQQEILKDRDLVEKAKSAFVSYMRSYKEHKLNLIFRIKDLNIGKVATSFFLFRLPRVKEILGKEIDFENQKIDLEAIPFKDKNQEIQYKLRKEQKLKAKQEELTKELQAQQQKKQNKEVDIKNNRQARRRVKKAQFEEEQEEWLAEIKLMKKLKQKKITKEEYDLKISELNGESD